MTAPHAIYGGTDEEVANEVTKSPCCVSEEGEIGESFPMSGYRRTSTPSSLIARMYAAYPVKSRLGSPSGLLSRI